jgi:hypothetical protein
LERKIRRPAGAFKDRPPGADVGIKIGKMDDYTKNKLPDIGYAKWLESSATPAMSNPW